MKKISDRIQILDRHKLEDDRGWFLKIIAGDEKNLPNYTGEIYLINAYPGKSRANHYHLIANEWFTLISGSALLKLEDVVSKEKMNIKLNSDTPQTIYVPNGIAHSLINLYDEPYLLLAYSDKKYIPTDTITYKID